MKTLGTVANIVDMDKLNKRERAYISLFGLCLITTLGIPTLHWYVPLPSVIFEISPVIGWSLSAWLIILGFILRPRAGIRVVISILCALPQIFNILMLIGYEHSFLYVLQFYITILSFGLINIQYVSW